MRTKTSTACLLLLSFIILSCSERDDREGLALYNQGKYEEAISFFDQYLEGHPKDARAYYNRGRSYEELGKLEKAEASFKEAVMLEPKDAQYKMSLGICQFKQKNYSYTVGNMEQILKENDRNVEAYILMGRSYSYMGEIQEAIDAFDSALRLDKENGRAYLHRGRIKSIAGLTGEGCADLKKAKNLGIEGANELIKRHCAL